ncbi:hypothetical protein halTADL_3137 [Halohasta litchfieldiae]|jgi:hypothetical protein|uniref:SPW repeat-containing protein n=1 Tax=Halohasta litchfieldiae TaxID=1073996 RepID=A0A1H6SU86_9EURY|nr:hypothetical protein [Halohasta litchfieldiae]ATW89839.1 hypothetical protein halTADL_3137 [Halohasta litchfieldiae]SEI68337.1 hypothetical protein SAMN05444271_105152 [Halohasta litchfieldiae]
MERERLAPYLGAVACLILVALLSAPYFVIESQPPLLGDYYSAGPLGIVGALFLATLGVVIFLSSVRGRADPELVAGIMLVVGVTIFGLTALWAVAIDSTLLFSFPADYSWIEYHPWASLAVSGVVAGAAAIYAAAVY